MIDGNDTNYSDGAGYATSTWTTLPPQSFLITLRATVKIDCIRFLLWDRSEQRFYRYKLEICADESGQNWVTIADRSALTQECKGLQVIRFEPQQARLIRLTGTHNSANNEFHVVELQAMIEPPATRRTDFDGLDF